MSESNNNTVSSLEGEERGIPSVSARKNSAGGDPTKKIIGAVFLLLPIVCLGAYFYFKFSGSAQDEAPKEEPKKNVVKEVVIPPKTFVLAPEPEPALPEQAPPVVAPVDQPPPLKGDQSAKGAGAGNSTPAISKSGSRIVLTGGSAVAGSGGSRGGRESPYQAENDQRLQEAQNALYAANSKGGEETGAMKGMLEGTTTKMNYASQLPDRNYLIAKGTILQCVLQTKIVTSVAGMTKCVMPSNIYSDNGKVLLLERGSEITGEFQAGMKQGQPRIFVLWTRIKTPSGVVVDLSSPGTGQLGEAGVDGYIDTHFWKRFGGAIMLSLIDDLGNSIARESGNTSINLSGTSDAASDMAAEALRNSINIPPTLYKNQGEAVAVYLARDLDFRGVYDLRPE